MPRRKKQEIDISDIPPPANWKIPNIINNNCMVHDCNNQWTNVIQFFKNESEVTEDYHFCSDHAKSIGEIVLNEIAIFLKEGK